MKRKGWKRVVRHVSLLASTLALAPLAAQAQSAAAPSDSAMVNLVRLLVEQGVLTREKGDALMKQAEIEAQAARTATTQQADAGLPAAAPGSIRVPYIPESVRAQIREELRTEVLSAARTEGWASPGQAAPDWTKRLRLFGDIRARSQSVLYSDGNSNLIPDFARINQIGPIPIFERDSFLPLLNTRADRATRLQLRARLGLDVTVNDWVSGGLLLATGDDNSPISTNQSLGGGFGKRSIWLQNAYIKAKPASFAEVTVGRFPNPFTSTAMLFDDDLAFDGVTAALNSADFLGDDYKLTVRGGAFPLDFGDANFPQNDVDKRSFPDRWLFSGQAQFDANFGNDISAQVAVGYHSFTNLQANLSTPCFLYRVQPEFRSGVVCSTDNERATFLRKGNTVIPIRDIVLDEPPPALNEVRVSPQLVGLAFDYDILNVNASVKFPVNDELGVTLAGDYVRNLAFKKRDLCRAGATLSEAYPPLNNVGADGDGNICSQTNPSSFVGGNQGYQGMVTIGHADVLKRGQWRVNGGYRYLESDAVLDAFTDSDFHLGGTNTKGYFVGAKAAVFDNIIVGAQWLSANEITAEEPLSIDVLLVDFEIKF